MKVSRVKPYSREWLRWFYEADCDEEYNARISEIAPLAPYHDREARFVMSEGGERVCSGGFLPLPLVFAGATLETPLIGWVVTAKNHRRKGHARRLMSLLSDEIVKRGWSASFLSASESGARVYYSEGWFNFLDDVYCVLESPALMGIPKQGNKIAPLDPSADITKIVEIHDQCFAPYCGRIFRSQEYWNYLVRFKAVFRNGGYDKDLFLVAGKGRETAAYAVGHRGDFHHSNSRELTIYEIGCRNGNNAACLDLLRGIAGIAVRDMITRINIVAPLESEVMDLACSLGGKVTIDTHFPGHDMFRIHNLPGLLRELAPALESRLKSSRGGWAGSLGIESKRARSHSALIRTAGNSVKVVESGAADALIEFADEEALVHAVTGYRGFAELMRRKKAFADSSIAEELGRILFPRVIGWQSPLDTQ
ncbi:MAG TPA: GNAT family N-acetyltransferase [Candidatus Brocadiia bacterium]|nr:GNAT family N-acetyltransferase [Candidatus Brocadiia bacterium]